jgi:septum formation protein
MSSGFSQPSSGFEAPPPLVLASASPTRRRLLEGVGIACSAEPAAVDEAAVKASLRAEGGAVDDAARTLAELKALRISKRKRSALVVGADQILVSDGNWLDKPADLHEARVQLESLRGRQHELVTAACVARDEDVLWRHVARARLTMRPFSDQFLAGYLEELGETALESVGAYQLEGLGAQLFARIEGDFFVILGLPLLELLEFLRGHGVVAR